MTRDGSLRKKIWMKGSSKCCLTKMTPRTSLLIQSSKTTGQALVTTLLGIMLLLECNYTPRTKTNYPFLSDLLMFYAALRPLRTSKLRLTSRIFGPNQILHETFPQNGQAALTSQYFALLHLMVGNGSMDD